jgi:hypothetical protein
MDLKGEAGKIDVVAKIEEKTLPKWILVRHKIIQHCNLKRIKTT